MNTIDEAYVINQYSNNHTTYSIDKELGTIDSITDMKKAENIQHPSETKWMIHKA